MRRFSVILSVLTLLITATNSASAAQIETYSDGNSGRMYAIRVTPPALTAETARPATTPVTLKATADDFIQQNLALIGITDPATELLAAAPETDQLGISRVHYFQRWHGLDVLGGEITVHLNRDGQVHYVKTKIAKNLPADTTPTFTEAAAQSAALHLALDDTDNAIAPTVLRSRLIVLPLGILKNEPSTTSYLAWEITVVDDETGGDHWGATYFYDAHSGIVLFQLSGPVELNRSVKDCGYGNPATCSQDVESTLYPGYYHGRSEGMPVRGPYPDPNRSVFYGSIDVDNIYDYLGALHNYFSTTFGIDGANGYGGTIDWSAPTTIRTITRGIVHNDGSGFAPACPFGAAFSQNSGSITFCRGVVVPDVVAHEYSHAIVHHSFHDANGYPIGATYYGESGALNEAYADVMGEIFEHAYTGATDWLNGSTPPSMSPTPFRSIRNPPSLPFYEGGAPYPDRHYSASIICDSQDLGGVHGNSTVVSHAMYLFSEGGDFNGCTVIGQGMDATQRVYFRGWRTYFSQNETFQEAYTDLIQACTDLYPAPVVAELTKALQAAEMDQPGRCSGIPEAPVPCAVSGVASIPPPATASLRIISANPTRDATRFSYFTSRAGQIEVRVHDLMGRIVARPVDEYHVAGEQIGAWDGQLPNGESAPGGIYFISVALDKQVLGTAKLVVVR